MLINFNYVDLNHWLSDKSKHATVDNLYGGPRWQPALDMERDNRKNFLIREYGQALLEAGWRTTNFEMINNNNQPQYYLFFGAKHPRGMEVMKQAMRSVSPDGLFRYSDRTDPSQQRFVGMGMETEYAHEIGNHLFAKYRGQEVHRDVIVEQEIAWHPRWVDKDFNSGLRLLEDSVPPKILNVRNNDGRPRRKPHFPKGCYITFADYESPQLF